jgi:hypothetical protein
LIIKAFPKILTGVFKFIWCQNWVLGRKNGLLGLKT